MPLSRTPVDPWSFSEPDQRCAWPYQRWYNAHIARRTRYGVVRRSFDRPLDELLKQTKAQGLAWTLQRIQQAGVRSLVEFLDQVAVLAEAKSFCRRAEIAPADLVELLRHVYRRLLPLGAQMRQLVSEDDTQLLRQVAVLKKHKLSFSLAFLDAAQTRQGRQELARITGLSEPVLLDLAHRADLTRLWLMGGGMVRITWALGYRSLSDLQNADPDDYYERCVNFYNRIKGKPGDLTRHNCQEHIARMRRATPLVQD